MKKTRLLTVTVVTLAILITIIAVILHMPKERIIDDPTALFNKMLQAENADTCTYKITETDTISVGDETYIRKTQTTVSIYDLSTAAPTFFVQKKQSIGEHALSVSEWYHNNTLITEVNGASFSSRISTEEIKQRYIPKIILSPDIYTSIEGIETKENYEIHFSQATRPEDWLSDTVITLEQATGSAVINKDRTLCYLVYSAYYHSGDSYIQSNFKVEPIPEPERVPEIHTKDHISLQYSGAPEILEQACGYLLASKTIQAKYEDSILCEAFGDLQTQRIEIDANDTDSLTVGIKTQICLENIGKTGSENLISKVESFENGTYSIFINDSKVQASEAVSENDMRNLCQNILISTIILPAHISGCSTSSDGDSLTLTISAAKAFTDQIIEDACAKLYADPDILKDQSEQYETNQSTCYLTIDTKTGIPISSGFYYSGTYTINSIAYKLEYSARQEYSLLE